MHASQVAPDFLLSNGKLAKPFYIGVKHESLESGQGIYFEGDVYQEVIDEWIDTDGHQVAALNLVHFLVHADHPTLGKLTITYDPSRVGGIGMVRSVNPKQKFPAIHTTRLNVIAKSDSAPNVMLQNRGGPLEFKSEPIMEWPPKQNIYTLQVAVDFEDRRNPGGTLLIASGGSVITKHVG